MKRALAPAEMLFSPMAIPTVLDAFWGRGPLHVKGWRGKFGEIYSKEALLARLSQGWRDQAVPMRAVCTLGGKGPSRTQWISSAQAEEAVQAGATVCVSQFDRVEPCIEALCTHVRAVFGCPGEVHANLYWSPDGSGFDEHFDVRIATTLQIHGSKIWRFADRPMLPWPIHNASIRENALHYDDDAAVANWERECDSEARLNLEVVLQEGDLLCLPAGLTHAAKGKGESIALNLHFNGLSVGCWLGDLLAERMIDRPEWRHAPPMLGENGLHGGVRRDALAFVQARLGEAAEVIDAWRRNPRAFVDEVLTQIATACPSLEAASGAGAWRPSPRLMLASSPESDVLSGFVGAQRFEVEAENAQVLRAVLQLERVLPGELMIDGLEEPEIEASLDGLAEAGILVRE
jgi:hypothetical protein